MKKFVLFSVVFWGVCLYLASKFKTKATGEGVFRTSTEMFSNLLSQESTNGLFRWCCECIQFYANKFNCTYEELNIIIFVIFQPAMIVYLVLTIIFIKSYDRTVHKRLVS
jgi:hypothetical protein